MVKNLPQDTMVLTLGCGKYRFYDQELGSLPNGLPRLLDMGQCNDAYSALVVATVSLAVALLLAVQPCTPNVLLVGCVGLFAHTSAFVAFQLSSPACCLYTYCAQTTTQELAKVPSTDVKLQCRWHVHQTRVYNFVPPLMLVMTTTQNHNKLPDS